MKHPDISQETHMLGDDTVQRVVRAEQCEALAVRHIAHVLHAFHVAHLLATTTDKIEAIAHSVGYLNPFAFSNTCKRLTGFRPSDYRAKPRT